MENILITGITGQDGIFLTKNLLEQNQDCVIHGTSRNKDISSFQKNLSSLGVTNFDNIKIYNLNSYYPTVTQSTSTFSRIIDEL